MNSVTKPEIRFNVSIVTSQLTCRHADYKVSAHCVCRILWLFLVRNHIDSQCSNSCLKLMCRLKHISLQLSGQIPVVHAIAAYTVPWRTRIRRIRRRGRRSRHRRRRRRLLRPAVNNAVRPSAHSTRITTKCAPARHALSA